MDSPSCLDDPKALLVADTSVIINLNASRRSEDIHDILPNRIVVVEEVLHELEIGRRQGWSDADALLALVSAGSIGIVRFGETGKRHFEILVAGPAAQTLDDGEAATIAYALEHGATPLIDERKAHRICAERFPAMTLGCTGDLFAHDQVQAVLGPKDLSDAVYNALRHGRMRVMDHFLEWTVELTGPERAAKCPSLPRSVRRDGSAFDIAKE